MRFNRVGLRFSPPETGSQDVAGTEAFGFATDAWGCRAGQ